MTRLHLSDCIPHYSDGLRHYSDCLLQARLRLSLLLRLSSLLDCIVTTQIVFTVLSIQMVFVTTQIVFFKQDLLILPTSSQSYHHHHRAWGFYAGPRQHLDTDTDIDSCVYVPSVWHARTLSDQSLLGATGEAPFPDSNPGRGVLPDLRSFSDTSRGR